MTKTRIGLTENSDDSICAEWQELIDGIPYAKHLKLKAEPASGSKICILMPFEDRLIGNMLLPAIHGGTIGALMEITALVACYAAVRSERMPKLIDSTTDYLRSGKTENTWASAEMIRQGRRVMAVRTTAWQGRPERPVATGRMHLLTQNGFNQ